MGNKIIPVVKPNMPPFELYTKYLKGIWDRQYLTNNGPLVQELESKLKEYLGVKNCLFVTNGTIALQLAIRALDLKGEIITTPFSFVATTSTIVWENCTPVFVDIDEYTLNIDPNKIEKAITNQTTAILATHVFGNPCHILEIERIASKYNLKVIYDAAHAFGVNYYDKSLLSYGNISTVSFHATKLFSTVEGGAIITNDDELALKISEMRNFGIKDTETFTELGVNAKNSEIHAAFGLSMLPMVKGIISHRNELVNIYDEELRGLDIFKPRIMENTEYNFAYYPIIFPSENILLCTLEVLKTNNIFPRRYFYPSLNKLPYVKNYAVTQAESISNRILCLPLFEGITKEDIKEICELIREVNL